MEYNFVDIISNFQIDGKLLSCERYGEGHINTTYLAVVSQNGKKIKYILQKINDVLFKDVDKLMSNIRLVTEFNRDRIKKRGGNPDRESLSLVYTNSGEPYYYDLKTKGYYRVYKFITDAIAYQKVEKPEHFYQSAVAFGDFANLLAEFDASKLYEILPGFHDTEKRFCDLCASIKADKVGRAKSVQKEIQFVFDRKDYCGRIVNLLKTGEMPTKVTHNDTKLNNVMLDAITGAPVAVIDLDTIMPGSICYDFGDAVRYGCNPAKEDEKDISNVRFDINLFEEYTKGYLKALKDSVTKVEKDNLAFSAILITLECGIRFLTDYLDGDVYFRIKSETHNIDRARAQFKLVEDMDNRYEEMRKIVDKY